MGAPSVFRYYESDKPKDSPPKKPEGWQVFRKTLEVLAALALSVVVLLGLWTLHAMFCHSPYRDYPW
jgi:hypothetical protein